MHLRLHGIVTAEYDSGTERHSATLIRLVNDKGGRHIGTHSVPAGFDLDVRSVRHELLAGVSFWEEREKNCRHVVSVDVPHCESIVEEMWTGVVKSARRGIMSIICLQQSNSILNLQVRYRHHVNTNIPRI